MRIKDLILRLRIKYDNKLSKIRTNFSSMAPKANIVEQMQRPTIKIIRRRLL
jgi:hypothetical protein